MLIQKLDEAVHDFSANYDKVMVMLREQVSYLQYILIRIMTLGRVTRPRKFPGFLLFA